jgi:ubiquinone/menaquinone biosynthesis C-methylase UbiE
VAKKWEDSYQQGSDKQFPNLDLVRLEKWFFNHQPGKLLEYAFGCGVNMLHMLREGYTVEAIDASPSAKKLVESKLQANQIDPAKYNLHLVTPETTQLPFADETFDYVTCISVLSLLGSVERATHLLHEFKRVMKPGAKIIVDINGHTSDFAAKGKLIEPDVYEFMGESNTDPVRCLCFDNVEKFKALIEPVFHIEDVGYSCHKYFHSEIIEYIICAYKPE